MRASGSMQGLSSSGLARQLSSGALKSLSSDMKSEGALQGDLGRILQDQNNPQKLQADLKQLFQDAKNPQKLIEDLKKLLKNKLPPDLKAQLDKILREMEAFAKQYFGDSFTPAGKGGGGGGGGQAAGAGGGGGGGGAGGASGAGGGGGGGGAGGAGGADGAAGGGAPSQAGGADGAGAPASATGPAGIQTNDPRIAQALQQIASDPVGAKLLAAAQANGLTSITADTSLNPSGGAGLQGQTVTGANGKPQIQIANPNSPDLIHTLVHELGHAATTGDGDSKAEEMLVDKLGSEVQQRLTGRADPSSLDMSAYAQLAQDNGIANDLARLGIAA